MKGTRAMDVEKTQAYIEIKDGCLFITPKDNYIEFETAIYELKNESVYAAVHILPF